jgi:hypothetical protein
MRPTFEEFVNAPQTVRSAWVREPGIELYFRKPNRFSHTADFDLPNMQADRPGHGALRTFLDRYGGYTFLVQGIFDEWLVEVFARRGYRKVEDGSIGQTSMIHASCKSVYDSDWESPNLKAADLLR